jgi:hypothetical protein
MAYFKEFFTKHVPPLRGSGGITPGKNCEIANACLLITKCFSTSITLVRSFSPV